MVSSILNVVTTNNPCNSNKRNYNKFVNVTFDPAKDAANLAKHGLSLLDAVSFEWETALVWPDRRHAYGEARSVALGYIGLRLMVVVFVERPPELPTERRIISLRKANTREVKRYAET